MQKSCHIAEQVILVGLIHCSLGTSLAVGFNHITFYPIKIPSECCTVAKELMISGNPCPLDPVLSEDNVEEGLKKQEQKNTESVQ